MQENQVRQASKRKTKEKELFASTRSGSNTVLMTQMAVLIAVSVILGFIHFPLIPAAPYLEYEFSDIPILIAGLMFGTMPGVVIAVLSILLQDLLAGTSSGPWGVLMHLIAALTFLLVSSLIFKLVCKIGYSNLDKKTELTKERIKRSKTKIDMGAALAGLIVAGICLIIVMIPANLLITPRFLGAPVEAVRELLPVVIIPFNALKAVINICVTFAIFAPFYAVVKYVIKK